MRTMVALLALIALPAWGGGLDEAQRTELRAHIEATCDAEGEHSMEPERCRRVTQEAATAAYTWCQRVAQDLKDRWFYFEDFEVYKLGWTWRGQTEGASCTLSARHRNTDKVREARVDIRKRPDSDRMSYKVGPDDFFPACRELFTRNCQ